MLQRVVAERGSEVVDDHRVGARGGLLELFEVAFDLLVHDQGEALVAALGQPPYSPRAAGDRLLLDVQHPVEIDQRRAVILEHCPHRRRSPIASARARNTCSRSESPSEGRVACRVVPDGPGGKLDRRVVRAAEAALAQRKFVTTIDVLMGLGWLEPRRVDEWRQGRIPYLEAVVTASLGKISAAIKVFRNWAQARGLKPSETAYVARIRDRRPLRFSKSGEEAIERAYRTHWVSPELSEPKRERLAERQSRPPDLVVVSPVKEWTCAVCGSEDAGWLIMEDRGPVCLACVDMDHLVFLSSGDAALTRRAKQHSRLSTVVVRFSRARKRRGASLAKQRRPV